MAQSQLGKYAPHPRTVVVDTVAETMDGVKTENQVDAILDSSLSSTEAAIRNSKPLADWDEYNTEL